MPRFQIQGRIEPSLHLDLRFTPEVRTFIQAANVDLRCKIVILNSELQALCYVDRWEAEVLPWCLNYVCDFVQAEIALVNFASAQHFSAHFDTVVLPDGSRRHMVPELPTLCDLSWAVPVVNARRMDLSDDLRELFHIVCARPILILALRDLSGSMEYGSNTLAVCGRAIECMRLSMWGRDFANTLENRLAWKTFRTNLNLSKSYLHGLAGSHGQLRHDQTAYMAPDARQDAARKAWTVMNRLLVYYLNGESPLPKDAFPEL